MGSLTDSDNKFSLPNVQMSAGLTASIIAVVVTSVIYIADKYQSKEEARKMETRIEKVEDQMAAMRSGINEIHADVSYIRGRLEPKGKN